MNEETKQREIKIQKIEEETELVEKRISLKEKKRIERQLKNEEGEGWKKVVGIIGRLKADPEQLQNLYASGRDLKDASIPRMGKMR